MSQANYVCTRCGETTVREIGAYPHTGLFVCRACWDKEQALDAMMPRKPPWSCYCGQPNIGRAYCISCGKPRSMTEPAKEPEPESSALSKQVGGTHYKDMVIQPVEFITKNGLGFLQGCIIKRICRYKAKGGVEDLRKAIHEIELLIEMEGRP